MKTDILLEDSRETRRFITFDDGTACMLIEPPGYAPEKPADTPVLLFGGHGSEGGFSNITEPEALNFRSSILRHGSLIICPDCGKDSWGSEKATTIAMRVLVHLEAAGYVLPRRLLLCGFSMGGLAALMFAARHPQRVRQILDVFGALDLADLRTRFTCYRDEIDPLFPTPEALAANSPYNCAEVLKQFSIRIFHGGADTVIPMEYSERFNRQLLAEGADVSLTVLPAIGHSNAIMREACVEMMAALYGAPIKWCKPYDAPMQLCGFPWFEENGREYYRLPRTWLPEQVTQYPNGVATAVSRENCNVFGLAEHTAGGQIRFRTDSVAFSIRGRLRNADFLPTASFYGQAGFDLYLREEGDSWQAMGAGRFVGPRSNDFNCRFAYGLKRTMREVLIDFPPYAGVEWVEVGLDQEARVLAPMPFADDRPILWYGTSITQGGFASRAGMVGTNILSRAIDQPVINLGFAGSGKGEPEFARLFAEVPNPALFIIDYAWNVDDKAYAATLDNVIDIFRERHPHVPVLLLAPTPGREACGYFDVDDDLAHRTEYARQTAQRRREAGDTAIRFLDVYHDALGEDFSEALVDGCHMTDIGFYRQVQAMLPVVTEMLSRGK